MAVEIEDQGGGWWGQSPIMAREVRSIHGASVAKRPPRVFEIGHGTRHQLTYGTGIPSNLYKVY